MKQSKGVVGMSALVGLIVLAVALPFLNKLVKKPQDTRNLAVEINIAPPKCGAMNMECCKTEPKCIAGECNSEGYCKPKPTDPPTIIEPTDIPTRIPTRKIEPTTQPIGGCGYHLQKCCPGNTCKPLFKDMDDSMISCESDGLCHEYAYVCSPISRCGKWIFNTKDRSDEPRWGGGARGTIYDLVHFAKETCEHDCTCTKVGDGCCPNQDPNLGTPLKWHWCENGLKCEHLSTDWNSGTRCYNPIPVVCQKGKYSCDLVNKEKLPKEIGCGELNIECYANTKDAIEKCKKECTCSKAGDSCCLSFDNKRMFCENGLECGSDKKCGKVTVVCQKGKYSCGTVTSKTENGSDLGCGELNIECYANTKDAIEKCKKECTCSKAGDSCCLSFDNKRMFCENGLECGSDKKCRISCGRPGEPCCEGDKKCDAVLGCNPADNTCQYVYYECNSRKLDQTQQCLPQYDVKTNRPRRCDFPTATCYTYQGICKMNCDDCGKEDHICCTASDGKSRYCTNDLFCNRTPTPDDPGDNLCKNLMCGMSGESCPVPGDPEITNTPTPVPTTAPKLSPTSPPRTSPRPLNPSTCRKNKGSYGGGPDIFGADYDCNGAVNIGDYSVWRKEFVDRKPWNNSSNWWTDVDGDGDVNNDSGYSRWRGEFLK